MKQVKKEIQKIQKLELTTTLKQLKKFKPCQDGLDKLINYLGQDFPETKSINFLTILKSNGLNHFFWALRVLPDNPNSPKRYQIRLILSDILKRTLKSHNNQEIKCI